MNFKRKTIKKIKTSEKELTSLGIEFKKAHGHVYHCWLNKKHKCNVYMTTRTWKSFNLLVKDVGFESLLVYLKNTVEL